MPVPTDATDHLSEEDVAAYVGGNPGSLSSEDIERHVARCSECCILVAAAAGSVGSDSSAVQTDGLTPVSPAPPLVALPRGSSLGRFTVLDTIGQGGMGIVYSAHDPVLMRTVAVKLLNVQGLGLDEEQAVAALFREAQALARLTHPNVTTAYEVGKAEHGAFVTMEFVEGSTLRKWLKEAPRSWSQVLDTFVQAGRGLAAAHAAGLIHRDFKPDNVLVGKDGRVRVTDFGLAHTLEGAPVVGDVGSAQLAEGASNRTTLGRVLGTPRYMPLEQLNGQRLDHRADVYSFCVSLYEALYGRHPYGERLEELMQEGAAHRVREVSRSLGVPSGLFRVLLRGLHPDPRERLGSMDLLLASLENARLPTRSWVRPVVGLAIATVVAGVILVGPLWLAATTPKRVAPVKLRSVVEAPVQVPPASPLVAVSPPEPRPVLRPTKQASRPVRRPTPPAVKPAPKPTPPAPPRSSLLVPARLSLTTSPPARVFFNGQALGTTPLRQVRVPAGQHVFRLVGPDGRSYLLPMQLMGGLASEKSVRLEALTPASP